MDLNLPAATFTTYIPPTTPPLTQFTPAPTCYPKTAGEQMWHITPICYPSARDGNPNNVPLPPCTYTRAGNPAQDTPECGDRWGYDQGAIGSCPVGFTSAGVDLNFKPFDRTFWAPTPPHALTSQTFDVTASAIICCPSVEGLTFKTATSPLTSALHSGVWFDFYLPLPSCYAHPATALDGRTVTMGVYHDSRALEKKKNKRQDLPWEAPGFGWGDTGQTTTAVFNAAQDTIWADEVRYRYTVFHATHTCYEKCDEYFSSSYYNTAPDFTPPPPPPPTTTPTITSAAVSSHPSSGIFRAWGTGGSARFPFPSNGTGAGAPFATSGGGARPPAFTGRPSFRSNLTDVVQSEAPGVRLGSLVVMSSLAVGFLGLTLAL